MLRRRAGTHHRLPPTPCRAPSCPQSLPAAPNCSQGLPVFYAPGEAEAVCAALSRAGCVDGCASNDSDCLLYGAEAVYHTLKLSVSGE